MPRRIAGLAGALLLLAGAADRGADVARPLPDAARVLGPVAELGDIDLRQRDRDQLAPGLADHLAVGDVLPQVGLDLAPDDLLEPIGIPLDFPHHGCCALAVGRQSTSASAPDGRSASRHIAAPPPDLPPDPILPTSRRAASHARRPRVRPQLRWQRSSRAMEETDGGGCKRAGDFSPAGTTSVQSDPHEPLANSIPGPDAYSSRPFKKAGANRAAPPLGNNAQHRGGRGAVSELHAQWLPRLTSPRAKMLAT